MKGIGRGGLMAIKSLYLCCDKLVGQVKGEQENKDFVGSDGTN